MMRIGQILQSELDAAEERRLENLRGARKKRVEDLLFDRLLSHCRPIAAGNLGRIQCPKDGNRS